MEEFRREKISIELYFTCVSEEYFYNNLREYYDFLSCELVKSNEHGFYSKCFYKLKVFNSVINNGLDMDYYYRLPCFVCTYKND